MRHFNPSNSQKAVLLMTSVLLMTFYTVLNVILYSLFTTFAGLRWPFTLGAIVSVEVTGFILSWAFYKGATKA